MTESHPSRFTLMRALSRELDAAEHERVQAHIGTCAACTRTYADLEELQHEGQREASPLRLPERQTRARLWLWPSLSLAGASMAAVFVIAVARHDDGETGIRAKGGAVVRFACKDGARVWTCRNGEHVRPGTAIAVRLNLDQPRFIMLLGRDATGKWTTYLPTHGDAAVSVSADVEDPLHGSLVLDATPGEERFVLVTASAPFVRQDLVPDDPQAWPKTLVTSELRLQK